MENDRTMPAESVNRAGLTGEPEVWALMRRRFQWTAEERGDEGEGLVHCAFGALMTGMEQAVLAGDIVRALAIAGFVEELLERLDELHPDVVNALDVSFFLDLYLGEDAVRDRSFDLLGPRGQKRWLRDAAFYRGDAE